jgi:hypothetical protein
MLGAVAALGGRRAADAMVTDRRHLVQSQQHIPSWHYRRRFTASRLRGNQDHVKVSPFSAPAAPSWRRAGQRLAGFVRHTPAVDHQCRSTFGASSPDVNPIEKAYSKLKAFLRKIAEPIVAGLLIALNVCTDIFKPAECANYFRAFRAWGYDTG